MRRPLVAGVIVVTIAGGLTILHVRECSAWQDDYKRVLYMEMMRNSPIVYTPKDIDRIIGNRPAGCERPTQLSNEDFARYRDLGAIELLGEIRNRDQPLRAGLFHFSMFWSNV